MRQHKRKNQKRGWVNQLTDLEASYRTEHEPEWLNKSTALGYEYNSIMSKNVSKLLVQVRQRYFELGEKPSSAKTVAGL